MTTNEYRAGVDAHWPFLSDAGRIVQKDLDIAEYTDPTNNPMIPHTIVLEPSLKIFKIYNGYWFFARPTHRRASPGLASRIEKVPAGLGHHRSRTKGRLGSR